MNTYTTGSNESITHEELIQRLKQKIEQNKGQKFSLIFGADSQEFIDKHNQNVIVYCTAIALHIIGNGGIFFIKKEKTFEKIHLSTRLFNEVQLALTEAEKLKKIGLLDSVDKIEIHCDVGNNGKSRDYAAAVKGMVEGFGYKGFIKPEASAASVIADRHTK